MSDVLTVGELLAEFMAERVGQTFSEPGTFLGPYPSGAPAIFADQVAKTGTSAAMVGWVGEDGFADLILNRLRGDGVDVSGIHRTDRLPTGTAFVTYRKDGSREFIFNLANSATSLIDANSVDASLTDGCRFFHVMGTSLTSEGMIEAVKRGIRRVKEGGGRVSFDPNIRREVMSSDFIRDAIDFVLKECDILLPSEADLQYFCGNLAEAEAVRQLFSKWALERVVVKNAAHGSAREALFALSHIEEEWVTDRPLSDIRTKLDEVMMAQPKYWEPYYGGTEAERALARKYSFSDRLRYYWPDPTVEASFQILVKNLSETPPPLSLLSQFAPSAFRAIRNGELNNDPLSIIRHRIQEVLGMYARACGMSQTQAG